MRTPPSLLHADACVSSSARLPALALSALAMAMLVAPACGGDDDGRSSRNNASGSARSGSPSGSGSGDAAAGGGAGSITPLINNAGWSAGDPVLCESNLAPKSCERDEDCANPLMTCIPGGCGGSDYCALAGPLCREAGTCYGPPTLPQGLSCSEQIDSKQICQYDCDDDAGCDGSTTYHTCDQLGLSCPEGHTCEARPASRTCIDRRLPCDVRASEKSDGNCAPGYVCAMGHAASPFCQPATVPCTYSSSSANGEFSACQNAYFTACVDLFSAGNGQPGRCYPPRAKTDGCSTHAECAGKGSVCGFVLEDGQWRAGCTGNGGCRTDADCRGERVCRDLDNRGVKHCAPVYLTTEPLSEKNCRSDISCDAGSRCMELGSDATRTQCACYSVKQGGPTVCD